MNILVIGNGFDLAHGFPTTYKDFLKFSDVFKRYRQICKKENVEAEKISIEDRGQVLFLSDLNRREQEIYEQLEKMLVDNVWIKYFWGIYENKKTTGKDGWIDFENEISKVIQTIDKVNREIQKSKQEESSFNDILLSEKQLFKEFELGTTDIFNNGIDGDKKRLLKDLNKLIRGLEIYLAYYVGRMTPELKIPDIEALDIHCVLSFNYTDTYSKLYCTDGDKKIEYDYIHGKINPIGDENTSNLILGIDEYLQGEEKRINNEFIEFKKFYQRIYKKTGCIYTDWVKNIYKNQDIFKKSNPPKNNVYIIGHSLDITDGDILKELINLPNTKTTIFYHTKEAFGKQISNLVKILGEDELISKVHGSDASIVFCEQAGNRLCKRLPSRMGGV